MLGAESGVESDPLSHAGKGSLVPAAANLRGPERAAEHVFLDKATPILQMSTRITCPEGLPKFPRLLLGASPLSECKSMQQLGFDIDFF